MDKITIYIILIFCYILSPTGAGTLFTSLGFGCANYQYTYDDALSKQEEAERKAIEKAEQEAKLAEQKLHTYSLFKRTELSGYGFVEIPNSHFTLNTSKSTPTERFYDYLDGVSSLKISYKTNMTDEELNNLDKLVCNMTDEPEISEYFIDTYKVSEIKSLANYDGFDRKSWCVTKGKSVIIFDTYTAPDLDTSPIDELMQEVLKTINIYYVSNTVFKTPTTGYYASEEFKKANNIIDEPSEDTSETINPDGTVGGNYEGTLVTDRVTDRWTDMIMILDGDKIGLPSTVGDFRNLGYKVKDEEAIGELVKSGYNSTILMYKDNGVAVRLKTLNNTDSSLRLDALTVETITVNIEDFGYYSANAEYTSENLPEFIFTGGITWDIKAEDITKILGSDFSKKELSNGDYQITYMLDEKQLKITTHNYKDIKIIELTDRTQY